MRLFGYLFSANKTKAQNRGGDFLLLSKVKRELMFNLHYIYRNGTPAYQTVFTHTKMILKSPVFIILAFTRK